MAEKSYEAWEVSLASLHDYRKIATIGVHCNGCGHDHTWPIEELVARHKPWALVSDLWKRWRCSKCGSRDVLPLGGGKPRASFASVATALMRDRLGPAHRLAGRPANCRPAGDRDVLCPIPAPSSFRPAATARCGNLQSAFATLRGRESDALSGIRCADIPGITPCGMRVLPMFWE